MPFLAKHVVGQVFNVIFTLALLAAIVGMTYYSYAKDRADPAHQRAIAVERQQAHRVRELIRHEGIPPTGALTLLRNDPKTQGPRLFGQQCSTCHDHTAGGGDPLQDIKAEKSTAPNLARYASREWLAGLLDPKKINGPQYFGNTKFRGGKMAGFVKDNFSEFDAAESGEGDRGPFGRGQIAFAATTRRQGRQGHRRRTQADRRRRRLHGMSQVPRQGQVGRRPRVDRLRVAGVDRRASSAIRPTFTTTASSTTACPPMPPRRPIRPKTRSMPARSSCW